MSGLAIREVVHPGTIYIIAHLRSPWKSELPEMNDISLNWNATILTNALIAAEYELYDTFYIRIGYDKGYIN